MADYRVRSEFRGPASDPLLHLIRREEVDIYDVNLTKIATEFIDHLNRCVS
jgi:chromatin segregation and condensation protein Rec8/ScpA/Scc1 (kleisin family)